KRRVPALRKYLEKKRPHTLLSAQRSENCNAVRARKLANCHHMRLVIAEHTTMSISLQQRRKLRGWWQAWRSYRQADRIVAVSRGVADDLARTMRLPRERIDVIYNPVVTPRVLELSRAP